MVTLSAFVRKFDHKLMKVGGTLQTTKNWKQTFPEKELCDHSPDFHIHLSVSHLYIPMIDLPILLQEICGLILGICKLLTDT